MKSNFDSDNIKSVAQQFEESLSLNQSWFVDSQILEVLILHYLDVEQLDFARKACQFGLDTYPYSSCFLRLNAVILAESKNYDTALQFIASASQMEGDLVENYLVEADILMHSNRTDEAENVLNKAMDLFGACSQDLLFTRLSLYEKRLQYSKAFQVLKDYLFTNDSDDQLLARVFFYTEVTESYDESITLHKHITDNDPYSCLAWYNLGSCYSSLEQFDLAIDAYEFSMVINPEFDMAYVDCANAYFSMGMYEKSIEIYNDYLEFFSLNADNAVHIGKAYEKIGQFKAAIKFYLEALRIDPQNDTAHHQIGLYYMEQNQWISSKESLKRAIEINPSESDYYASLGMVHFNLDETDLARDFLEKACDLAPDECCKWIQYAVFLLEIELPTHALDVIEESYMYCDSKKLDFCKAACLFTLGKRKEAFLVLRHALEQNKEDSELLYHCQPFLKEDTEILMAVRDFSK